MFGWAGTSTDGFLEGGLDSGTGGAGRAGGAGRIVNNGLKDDDFGFWFFVAFPFTALYFFDGGVSENKIKVS